MLIYYKEKLPNQSGQTYTHGINSQIQTCKKYDCKVALLADPTTLSWQKEVELNKDTEN